MKLNASIQGALQQAISVALSDTDVRSTGILRQELPFVLNAAKVGSEPNLANAAERTKVENGGEKLIENERRGRPLIAGKKFALYSVCCDALWLLDCHVGIAQSRIGNDLR